MRFISSYRTGAPLAAASVPAWLPAVNSFKSIASSSLTGSGAGWSGTSPGGTGNYTTVVTKWCGGVLVTGGVYRSGSFVSGKFLVIFGGGHGDYGGNELYAFGPLDGTPTWSRIIDPTIPAPDDVARSGGYPVSRHTYDTLQYDAAENRMVCMGCAGYYHTGFTFDTCDIFDFDTNPSGNPWSTADTGFALTGGAINLVSGHDTATGKLWGIEYGNGKHIASFTLASNTWTGWSIDNPDAPSQKGAVDPDHSILAWLTTSGSVRAVDLRSTPSIYSPSVTGSGPSGGPLEWDATGGRFVSWGGSGNTVYFLTPSASPYSGGTAWDWTSSSFGGDTVTAQTENGIRSRFRMVYGSGYRGILMMPDETGVFFGRFA